MSSKSYFIAAVKLVLFPSIMIPHSSYPEGMPRVGVFSAIFQPGVIRSSALVQAKDNHDLIDEEKNSAE